MIVFSSNGFSSWKLPMSDSPKDTVNPSHRQKRFTIKRVLKGNESWWLVIENINKYDFWMKFHNKSILTFLFYALISTINTEKYRITENYMHNDIIK